MSEIVLSGVSKRFPNGVKAVDGISLTIANGEFIVLVGPSGCGKTTLLRMIAGLETVDEGSIRLGDRDITHFFLLDPNGTLLTRITDLLTSGRGAVPSVPLALYALPPVVFFLFVQRYITQSFVQTGIKG